MQVTRVNAPPPVVTAHVKEMDKRMGQQSPNKTQGIVRREVQRLVRQIVTAPAVLTSYLFAARYYDLIHGKKVRRTAGAVGPSKKIAIYLIFPQQGLLASHLGALQYLQAKGYAPVVVSNIALDEGARAQILKAAHLFIERPNFGYDFGGYRDAILSVADRLPTLDHLCLLNDSTWFNLPGAEDWLDAAEALHVDLAAAASNYGIPRVKMEEFRRIEWRYVTTHKNFHFCSFALLFSQRVLADPAFLRFWRRFPLTSNKSRTVRRGEIGLSKWILARDYTHGTTCDITHLDRDLAALGDDRIRAIARNLISPDDPQFLAVKHDLLAANPSRDDLISLILTGVARRGSSYVLADYTLTEKHFPFLKKSPVWLNREASDITLTLAAALPKPDGEVIVNEIKALRAARPPRT